MKIQQWIPLTGSLVLLGGCGILPTTSTPHHDHQTMVKADTLFRGRITIGPEAQTLIPCGSRTQYALRLSSQQYRILKNHLHHPYQEMYAEVVGHLEQPEQRGSAFDYQAAIKVSLINFVDDNAIYQCSQRPQNTEAQGNHPKWMTRIQASTLTVMTAQPPHLAHTLTQVQSTPTHRTYTTEQGTLTLQAQFCQLGPHSPVYGWQATYQSGTTVYHGCGRIDNRDHSHSLVGTYTAQSQKNPDFSIELTLQPDHSATTTYRYHDGTLPIIENGFWQQGSPTTVEVIMTQHQQQYLPSERLFTIQGTKLHTDQEHIGHRSYSIADGGLTLFKTSESSK